MNTTIKFWIGLVSIITFLSCEDKISIDLNDAPPIIVIDAWLDDQKKEQKIKISQSQPYFDNSIPAGVSGATVQVFNSKKEAIVFAATEVAGEYTWNSNRNPEFFATILEEYFLEITLGNENRYTAKSQIKRVPKIDAIKFTIVTIAGGKSSQDTRYTAEFLATDFVGKDDTYWIKAYKNGKWLNKPFELNIAYDAGFGNVDGGVFIQPIQNGVHEFDKDLLPILYQLKDSLYVEILSITNEAYTFLEQVRIQTQRNGGFDEIFAEPFYNVPTNIVSNDLEEKVAGFFSVSSVNGKGGIVK